MIPVPFMGWVHSISLLESNWYMRNMLLPDSDWAGMAHSLEIRVPPVDLELTRAVAPLMQQRARPTKQRMAECAWSGRVPEGMLIRPKTGFSIPTREWLLEHFGAKGRGLRDWAEVVYREAPKLYACRKET